MKTRSNRKAGVKTPKVTTKRSPVNDDNNFLIVGIGASAGGLEALQLFFDNISPETGMAFIIVQHLDPTRESLLSQLLAKHTQMVVSEITDGVKVKPNSVYVIPPNKDIKLSHGTLRLFNPIEVRTKRRPIDSFFFTLANDQKDKAIGIVLSGTGTEGTLGLKEIKAQGGIAIAQEPVTAQFRGMPESAIAGSAVDAILPPEKIPELLNTYLKRRSENVFYSEIDLPPLFENSLQKLFIIIRNQTGYDFSGYKTKSIARRVAKRIAINQLNNIQAYVDFLEKNPDEVVRLYKDFLIGVTSFFRDKEIFKLIETKAVPHLLKHSLKKQELRIWVCGCSTGEEAYSLALLFREALAKNKQFIKIIIFATDIDSEAIEIARNGIYSERISADVSPEMLSLYFVKTENGYQVKKEIREMVVFAQHNVIKTPPFSKMDMISCRNLLIYMTSELQRKIIPLFHYSLNSEGILLLGASESIGESSDLFSVIDDKAKLFKKRNVNTKMTKPSFELLTSGLRGPVNDSAEVFRKKLHLSAITEKALLDEYAPPSVIIDRNNEALYFSGNIGQYLEPARGVARLNILEMSKKGVKRGLEDTIQMVRTLNMESQTKLDVMVNDHLRAITLRVKPLHTKEYEEGALMVIFEPVSKNSKADSENATKAGKRKLKAGDLEKELKITREHLQNAIRDLETSNEDLQRANEEFQSSNEELQSTNEELETSKEELQSVNEELTTVNSELSSKIEQLSQANNDLNNLLRSIEVATIFLDRDLKIKRFTPPASKIFNLIPSDIDRPITQLSSNLLYLTLTEDVKATLRTLTAKSIEVVSAEGTWYLLRIIPYRTTDNSIEGVLITLVDISQQKRVEENLKKSSEHLNLILENLPAVPYVCVLEPEFKIEFVGNSCEQITGFPAKQFTQNNHFWINRIHRHDKKRIKQSYSNIASRFVDNQSFRWKCSNGKYRHFINISKYVNAEKGKPAYVIGIWQEKIVL